MSGISALLVDQVASLLPKTTAGACFAPEYWSQRKSDCNAPSGCCVYVRSCHTSCDGKSICGAWSFVSCWV